MRISSSADENSSDNSPRDSLDESKAYTREEIF